MEEGLGVGSLRSPWGEKGTINSLPGSAPTPCSGCRCGVSYSCFSLPEPYLEELGGRLCGAKETPLRLHIQDVEQVRGLGLARKVDDQSEAVHSARAIVVELGVETVGWPVAQLPGCSSQDLRAQAPPLTQRLLPTS